jgi:hypothetical protein
MRTTYMRLVLGSALGLGLGLGLGASGARAEAPQSPPPPLAMVDLRTDDGLAAVDGRWRTHEAELVEVEHRLPDADGKPRGDATRTHDLQPHAGEQGFSDDDWPTIAPTSLEQRRGRGRLSFQWYRLRLRIPAEVAGVATAGATAILELVVDDYAEVSVDGVLPTVIGQRGGPVPAGWNAPSRVVLSRSVEPGKQIDVAILAMNGPFSTPPANYIWIRSAVLELHRPGALDAFETVATTIERKRAALDGLIGRSPQLERAAGGFRFAEGPVWHPDGYLLFSDPNSNVIHRWTPAGDVSTYRSKSGLRGPNGIALSPDETLLYVGNWDEHNKVIMRYRVGPDCTLSNATVFADLTAAPGEEAIDGVEVDERGNVYASGPGGLWIFAPSGTHLGTVRGPEQPSNFAWGGADGRTLFWTARTGLYRMRMAVRGAAARRPRR